VNVEFVASIAPITADPAASRRLYVGAVGLPLEGDEYIHSENVPGSRHFGIWPLAHVAEACFGTSEWPADRPVPQASIEFDLADADAVGAAEAELRDAGYEMLHPTRTEPWAPSSPRGAGRA
jgi:hypothetical protein